MCAALALLSISIAILQVFDNPFVHIVVSEVIRKRLDTKSIIQLLRRLDAPPGNCVFGVQITTWPLLRLDSCSELAITFFFNTTCYVEAGLFSD